MKLKRIRTVLVVIVLVIVLIVAAVLVFFWRVLHTGMSVRRLEDGLYAVEYQGDYKLDEFLEQGGAATDLAVADYVIQDLFYGLVDLTLRGSAYGCSTLAASDGADGKLFGRNFDWGYCNAMIVETKPEQGYASISTVNMDFLNVGLNSLPEELRLRLLASAAPYAPMDGMNEMGLCAAVLMIEDRPGFDQDKGKTDLTTTTAVRMVLDKAATVDEAVALLREYDLHASMGMMVHFALADATGRSVVVEYIDNEMTVVETPVVTNFYLAPGKNRELGVRNPMSATRC